MLQCGCAKEKFNQNWKDKPHHMDITEDVCKT